MAITLKLPVPKMMYTICRCAKTNGRPYGVSHASKDGEETMCGIRCYDPNWYILSNDTKGVVTCKHCIAILQPNNQVERQP